LLSLGLGEQLKRRREDHRNDLRCGPLHDLDLLIRHFKDQFQLDRRSERKTRDATAICSRHRDSCP
jgi:hypothetical protein